MNIQNYYFGDNIGILKEKLEEIKKNIIKTKNKKSVFKV